MTSTSAAAGRALRIGSPALPVPRSPPAADVFSDAAYRLPEASGSTLSSSAASGGVSIAQLRQSIRQNSENVSLAGSLGPPRDAQLSRSAPADADEFGALTQADLGDELNPTKRVSVLDFLSAGPRVDARGSPSGAAAPRASQDTHGSASGVMASPSLGTGLHAPGGAADVGQPRPRPPPISAQAGNRMSTLLPREPTTAPLLSTSPSLGSTSVFGAVPSQTDAPLSAFEFLKGEPRGNVRAFDGPASAVAGPSTPAAKRRPSSFAPYERKLKVRVTPVSDQVTMFGSTQTSSNYSISGTVIITIAPREIPAFASSSGAQSTPTRSDVRRATTPASPSAPSMSPTTPRFRPEPLGKSASDTEQPASPVVRRTSVASPRAKPTSPRSGAGQTTPGSRPLSTDFSHMLPALDFGLGPSYWDVDSMARRPSIGATLDDTAVATTSAVKSEPAVPEVVVHSSSPSAARRPRPKTPAADSEREKQDELKVTSLKVVFSGYSFYADHAGRFSAVRLAEVVQELLPTGSNLPISGVVQPHTPLKYDIQFDLSIPGWLPATSWTKFGGTFYCVHAEARYLETDGRTHRTVSTLLNSPHRSSAPSGLTATPDAGLRRANGAEPSSPRPSGLAQPRASGSRHSASPSPVRLSVNERRDNASSGTDGDSAAEAGASNGPSRSGGSWLGKRARQLQFRKSSAAPPSPVTPTTPSMLFGTPDNPVEPVRPPVTSRRRRRRAPEVEPNDGSLKSRSRTSVIIVRRCRDVVPVPVARLAIVGAEGLPSVPQDPPNWVPGARLNSVERPKEQVPVSPSPSSAAQQSPVSAAALATAEASPRPESAPAVPAAQLQTALDEAAAGARPAGLSAPLASPRPRLTPRVSTEALNESALSSMLPLAPSTLDAPTDPAKFAAFARAPATPVRGSSAVGNRSPGINARGDTRQSRGSSSRNMSSNNAMRHFLHRPVLHPPFDSGIAPSDCDSSDGGLAFSLTLSLPSHVQVDGPNADMLSFGVQIEVGRSLGWSKVRGMGGLRLRDMDLVCVQQERHCSVPSRTFCNAFPLPTEPAVDAHELPELVDRTAMRESASMTSDELKKRHGYDHELVLNHLTRSKAGEAPDADLNAVERLRTAVVGPPPTAKEAVQGAAKGKGKGKDKSTGKTPTRSAQAASLADVERRARRLQMERARAQANAARSGPSGSRLASTVTIMEPPSPNPFAPSVADEANAAEGSTPDGRRVGRGRRAYETAMRGLSTFANALAEMSIDGDVDFNNTGAPLPSDLRRAAAKDALDDDSDGPRATYHFAGDDGHGVDLTRGRVRMTINLPLVPASATVARQHNVPRLVADFESPYVRIKHKLRVKLGFGFGSKPLGGDSDWGQALVLQVPVRFTEAAPKDVREQFAPISLATVTADPSGALTMPLPTIQQDSHSAPVLPAYAQLFREDGSRLADEGEDLPQYPGPTGPVAATHRGSVSAGSPRLGSGVSRSRASSVAVRPSSGVASSRPASNHILPSSIYDEAPDAGSHEAAERDHERELQELRSEAEMLAVHLDDASSEDEDMLHPGAPQRSRLDETINASDLEEEDHGALMHSSSDPGTQSPLPHGGGSTTDTSRRGSVATGVDSGHGSSSPAPRASHESQS